MRHVMLVGATDGIGLALCHRYLADGWRVALVGRNPGRLASAAAGLAADHPQGTLVTAECDVRDREAIAGVFDRAVFELGQLDLIVFCAGIYHTARRYKVDPANELDTFDVNLLGAVSFVALAANYFVTVGRGHIAVIGSIAGERGRGGNPAYCASKAGIDAYLEGLRVRLHPLGIRVTNVKPGFVNTKLLGGKAKPGMIEPADAAARIKRRLDRGSESFFVPWWWWLVALGMRAMPRFLFKRFSPR